MHDYPPAASGRGVVAMLAPLSFLFNKSFEVSQHSFAPSVPAACTNSSLCKMQDAGADAGQQSIEHILVQEN